MTAELRLVYDADAPARPPRPPPRQLESIDELEEVLRELLRERFDGEVVLRGHSTAKICLYAGTVAWVRSDDHPEHLGDVLRRELGLGDDALRRGIEHCRATGQRFGEGMVALGLLRPIELREALRRHIADQLIDVQAWPGPVEVEHSGWPHRYDPAFTFELDELLLRPCLPDPSELSWLDAVLEACRSRLPELGLACVVEVDEGTVLRSVTGTDPAAEDLMGLCLAGMQRLVGNRITGGDGAPRDLVLVARDTSLLVHPIETHPGWSLLLAGPVQPGRLLSVATAALAALG